MSVWYTWRQGAWERLVEMDRWDLSSDEWSMAIGIKLAVLPAKAGPKERTILRCATRDVVTLFYGMSVHEWQGVSWRTHLLIG